MQPVIFLLILASIALAACGAEVSNQNWPGLSTAESEEIVYVAHGPGVMAVDLGERRQLWQFPEETNPSLQFYAPPSVREEQLVIGDFGASGGLFSPASTVTIYALDNNGAEPTLPAVRWSRDDLARDRIVAAPLQVDDKVFVGTSDNRLLALDVTNGDLLWEFETGHSVWAQPVYDEGTVYVASLDNSVYALNADSGEELWRAELSGSIADRPILVEDILYVSSFDRAVHALDAGTGEEIWVADAGDWVWGAPTVNEGAVFFGDISGNIYAVEADSGETLWTQTVSGAIQSAPLYVDGILFVASGEVEGDEDEREGEVLALAAEDGSEVWRRQAPAPVFSTLVSVGESVIVAVQDQGVLQLLVYDMDSGDLVWNYTPPSE